MKKVITLILVVLMIIALAGCAGFENRVARDGSWLGTTKADYVVINYSGNKIMDVWVLTNQFVQSEGESDGWNFIDDDGNSIMLGGDVKIIRINDAETFTKYKEYHYEFDGGDYYDFLKQ